MSKINRKLLVIVIWLAVTLLMVYVSEQVAAPTFFNIGTAKETGKIPVGRKKTTSTCCVVIDAGHGGIDPGKIGINKAQEKDLNLEIAKKVKQYLEANDVLVVMTREDDSGLYREQEDNKKVRDMKKRIEIIEETKPRAAISIHQNSYPEEYVHGAQVFYYTGSAEGKALAERIQNSLKQRVDYDNKRDIKENKSYYLLKKTKIPIVIAECGFLSNREEAAKLCTTEYQQRVAWAITMGILQYLNQ